jgi:hypothetical protein
MATLDPQIKREIEQIVRDAQDVHFDGSGNCPAR